MRYIEQEESYTSQASCLDLDDIPVYNPEQPYTGTFSGKRIHRGLYQFADGRIANADVNGAYNILRKSKQNFDFEGLCKGAFGQPFENKDILTANSFGIGCQALVHVSNFSRISRFYKRDRFNQCHLPYTPFLINISSFFFI